MEVVFQSQQASTFSGQTDPLLSLFPAIRDKKYNLKISKLPIIPLIPRKNNIGKTGIGEGHSTAMLLSQALEYNFSENFVIIGGSWFLIAGHNTPSLVSAMLELNLTW